MIHTFDDDATSDIFHGRNSKNARRCVPESLLGIAQRKLDMINAAVDLNDLRVPPGNRLEALKGAQKSYHSIRINDQYRIVFLWTDLGAQQVKITDYH